MERGRKMMEKWGWKDGDGLGKDGCGMTTALNVRTDQGYATVEHMLPAHPPTQHRPPFPRLGPNQQFQGNQFQQPRFNANPQVSRQFPANMRQSQFGPSSISDMRPRFDARNDGQETMRNPRFDARNDNPQFGGGPMQPRQSQFGIGDPSSRPSQNNPHHPQSRFDMGGPPIQVPQGPDHFSAGPPDHFSLRGPIQVPLPGDPFSALQGSRPDTRMDQGLKRNGDDMLNSAEKKVRRSKWDMGSSGEQLPRPENTVGPYAISKASAMSKAGRVQPPDAVTLSRMQPLDGQSRWSEPPAPAPYKELLIPGDKRQYLPDLFGPHMRFTSRFVELFDCDAHISGWGTVIIRPRSAASKLDAGLTVIEEVLRQNDPVKLQELKQEYTIKPDAGHMARQGAFADDRRHVDTRPPPSSDVFEMLNIDPQNLDLVSKNLNDLQAASGALFGMAPNGNVCLQGTRVTVDKGKQAIRALIDTGACIERSIMPLPPVLPVLPPFQPSQIPDHIQKLGAPPVPPPNPINDVLLEAVIQVTVEKALAVQCMLPHITKCSEAEKCELSQEVVRNMKSVKAKGTRAALDKIRSIIQQLEQCGQSSILSDYLQGAMMPKPEPDAPPPIPPEFSAIPGLQSCSAQQKAVQGLQDALSAVPAPPPPAEPAPPPPSGIPGLESMDAIPGLGGLPWLGGLPLGNIPLPAIQSMVQPGMSLFSPGLPPV